MSFNLKYLNYSFLFFRIESQNLFNTNEISKNIFEKEVLNIDK